ncbi:MAG: hypothetical protein JOY58_05000 [Solirubrobacterales bacterium]|nr:hypothetical protein [Solirubrobacterales bacterium]MBV9047600.1 hypothetical protein [Solirubrobacterales bacterium]
MKLYVCWGTFQTFGPGHPCRNALDALQAAGHEPQVIRSHGWGLLPATLNRSEGRRLARRETGRSWLPLLVTDAGEIVAGSWKIPAWAQAHPATDPADVRGR